MRTLVNDLKEQLDVYTQLVEQIESKGLEALNSEEIEYYGVYVGKKELLIDLIPKLESFL